MLCYIVQLDYIYAFTYECSPLMIQTNTDAHAKNCMTPLEEIKIGPSDQSSL
jgi:hypothetical protein